MINEFNSSHQRVFRVNPQMNGALDVSVDSPVRRPALDAQTSPAGGAEGDAITKSTDAAAGRTLVSDASLAALSRYMQRLYAPSSSDLAASQPLFSFLSWYTVHVIYRGAAGALAIRTLLLSARVGRIAANLLSPVLALALQRLIRRAVPPSLTRPHRRFRDTPLKSSIFYGGVASGLVHILEVLIASGRCGKSWGRLLAAIGAAAGLATVGEQSRSQVARYIARECGLGFPTLPSLMLLQSMASEYREGCDLFAGMTGLVSCVVVSPDCVVSWTTLFAAASAFASFQAARCVVDRRLSVERLEKCLHVFSRSMQPNGDLLMLNDSALSATHITSRESILTPPLPWIHQRVPITFGDSFYTVLREARALSTRQAMQIVQRVEECLATRGVALIYNAYTRKYHVLFSGRLTPGPILDRNMLGIPSGGLMEVVPRFTTATPLSMKELWAYFYAFTHYHNGARITAPPPQPESSLSPDFVIISALTADGTVDLASKQIVVPFDFTVSREEALHQAELGVVDPLYPQFISFVDALVLGGWRLDHIRVPSEGWGIAVHYL